MAVSCRATIYARLFSGRHAQIETMRYVDVCGTLAFSTIGRLRIHRRLKYLYEAEIETQQADLHLIYAVDLRSTFRQSST